MILRKYRARKKGFFGEASILSPSYVCMYVCMYYKQSRYIANFRKREIDAHKAQFPMLREISKQDTAIVEVS